VSPKLLRLRMARLDQPKDPDGADVMIALGT